MFGPSPGKAPTKEKPQKFVVAFRVNDDITKHLISLSLDSGYRPEQIARYALKKYLAEIGHMGGAA